MAARILIVEDEEHIVESLAFILRREGFDVSSTGDGQKALAAVVSDPPDVLVLDAMLPGLDGYEIARRLRGEEQCRNLPILMLTAKGQSRDRHAAESSGVSRFMTKPFSNSEVLAAITELAER